MENKNQIILNEQLFALWRENRWEDKWLAKGFIPTKQQCRISEAKIVSVEDTSIQRPDQVQTIELGIEILQDDGSVKLIHQEAVSYKFADSLLSLEELAYAWLGDENCSIKESLAEAFPTIDLKQMVNWTCPVIIDRGCVWKFMPKKQNNLLLFEPRKMRSTSRNFYVVSEPVISKGWPTEPIVIKPSLIRYWDEIDRYDDIPSEERIGDLGYASYPAKVIAVGRIPNLHNVEAIRVMFELKLPINKTREISVDFVPHPDGENQLSLYDLLLQWKHKWNGMHWVSRFKNGEEQDLRNLIGWECRVATHGKGIVHLLQHDPEAGWNTGVAKDESYMQSVEWLDKAKEWLKKTE